MMPVQNHHFVKINFFDPWSLFFSGRIKLTANTGLKKKATTSEAASVRIRMAGR